MQERRRKGSMRGEGRGSERRRKERQEKGR